MASRLGGETSWDELTARALRLRSPGRRALLGIVGSPGSGKSTLAAELTVRINGSGGSAHAAVLPMDGFHLSNATLGDLGRAERKGALDTFDGWGFLALLRRVSAETSTTVYAPGFHREIETAVAADIPIGPETDLVIVEGNYLLAEPPPWNLVTDVFEETWFCEVPDDVRSTRLVHRHMAGGRSLDDSRAWARDVDGANAAFIESSRNRATIILAPPPLDAG